MKFSKIIVSVCIGCIIVYTIAALVAFLVVGAEPETLTLAVYGFFGTELCAMVVNRIFGDPESPIKKKLTCTTTQPKG